MSCRCCNFIRISGCLLCLCVSFASLPPPPAFFRSCYLSASISHGPFPRSSFLLHRHSSSSLTQFNSAPPSDFAGSSRSRSSRLSLSSSFTRHRFPPTMESRRVIYLIFEIQPRFIFILGTLYTSLISQLRAAEVRELSSASREMRATRG